MENRKQKRWPFRLPLKKVGIIIFVVCLLTFGIASAATVHYISKLHSLKPSAHQIGTDVNTNSQLSIVSNGVGQSPQSTISSSTADVSVDYGTGKSILILYLLPFSALGVLALNLWLETTMILTQSTRPIFT
jgi:hypothetical protein